MAIFSAKRVKRTQTQFQEEERFRDGVKVFANGCIRIIYGMRVGGAGISSDRRTQKQRRQNNRTSFLSRAIGRRPGAHGVKGLTPGLHGVHIHSVGKCEEPSFTTAGEHFNPAGKKHGLNSPAGPHAGDLPNMLVAKDGSRRFEVRTDAITFKVGAASVFDSDGAAP